VPGAGGLPRTESLITDVKCFAPSTRLARLLQLKAKQFPRQGTVTARRTGTVKGDLARVLVASAGGTLGGGLKIQQSLREEEKQPGKQQKKV